MPRRECVLIRHPRHGEYAFGFITGQTKLTTPEGDLELFSVYVPTNHVYVGDIFLLTAPDIIRHNLSVREGIGGWRTGACASYVVGGEGGELLTTKGAQCCACWHRCTRLL